MKVFKSQTDKVPINPPQGSYNLSLEAINGVFFTPREIDIIACISNGRGSKKTAAILSISPKTVECHIRNIMQKLGCRSQESIRDFIEKSGQLSFLKEYYSDILIRNAANIQSVSTQIPEIPEFPKLPKISGELKKPQVSRMPQICIEEKQSQKDSSNQSQTKGNKRTKMSKRSAWVFGSTFLILCSFALWQLTIDMNTQVANKVNLNNKFYGSNNSPLNLAEKFKSLKYCFDRKSMLSQGQMLNWNIPRQDHKFVGREHLLNELHTKLHPNSNTWPFGPFENSDKNADALAIKKLAISACAGLGGIGKTQLTLQYVHTSKYPYTLKAWFPAEKIDILRNHYREFAEVLGFSDQKANFESVVIYIKKWLREHPGWLIVYDNVSDYSEIEPFLPDEGGYVILTTRNRYWPTNFNVLSIDVMTEEEAVNTIKTLVDRKSESETPEIKELVKLLGYLPLALAQAGAYIQQNQISISEYLKLYKSHEMEFLADKTFPLGVNAYPVAVTWNISLQAIVKEAAAMNEIPLAIELLTVCSFLSPEKISREVLFEWLKVAHPELVSHKQMLNKHIGLLWRYSLVNYDDRHISIHRLVQVVLRNQLQKNLNSENALSSVLDLKWYETLLHFFRKNESDFKLICSYEQLLETYESFKSKFKDTYNDDLAALDLIITSVYFYKEKYLQGFNILKKVENYLIIKEEVDLLKCRLWYLYSTYYRKSNNLEKAQEYIDRASEVLEKLKIHDMKDMKDINFLQAKILYKKASICVAKNKKKELAERNMTEINDSIAMAKRAISLYEEINDKRESLRSIELMGRLLVLENRGQEVVEEFDKHSRVLNEIADQRIKMLFYITYTDAYLIRKDFKNALEYCHRAKQLVKTLDLELEMKDIHKLEEKIRKLTELPMIL